MAIGTDQTINPRSLLLLGASSQIGVFAIPRLIEAGFHVLALSRKGKPEEFPAYDQVEWINEAESVKASESCQYFLSAGPMQLAQKLLATGEEFRSAVVFSSSSVETKRASDNPAEREQIRDMLTLESELQLGAKTRGLKLVIFRPTLIYGCGLDTNISQLATWIRRYGFMPVNGKATGLRQPVHADDLAEAATSALLSKLNLPPMLYLSGGDTLSYSEMISRIFPAVGKPARILRLPQWLFVMLVKLAKIFASGGSVNEEMVRRQLNDLVFDDSQARELLGYDPRPFAPQGKDFSLPKIRKL
jgi:nucleoside-diphosphate-sugar epimerase